ncbi:MAG: AbrB/MazE/SpoVT family DNA-binding domain-containing protein [bacterium]
MRQYNANVLAKGQVVIPKELRDELEINVGDSLSCFTRGSAIILKKKINTTSYTPDFN